MADTAEAPAAKKQRRRTPAEHRYPLFDLNSSLAAAKAVKERGGNACTAAQLAAFLDYDSSTGGGFVRRVTAARLFGLIEHTGGHYKATARAESILYPVTPQARRRALAEAWLSIPLFRRVYDQHKGIRLPEEFGMRNLLTTSYSVSGQVEASRVYRVMMDSAEFAGFFATNQGRRTHLIEPVYGAPEYAPPPDEESKPKDHETPPAQGGGGGDGGTGSGDPLVKNLHPALRGLLTLIPAKPGDWPGRVAFDTAWTSTLDVLWPADGQTNGGGGS
jgi:hypothetical protein